MQMDNENVSSAALTVALDDYAMSRTLSLLLFRVLILAFLRY